MIGLHKRKFGRAPICVSATCTFTTGRVQGTLWQIGEGGFFVEVPKVAVMPPTLAIGFEVPGHGQHRAVARPVWKTESTPRSVPKAAGGMGCEFRDLAPTTREAIAAYVKKTKQTYSSLQLALALDRPTPQLWPLLRETGLAEIRDRRALKAHVAMCVAQLQAMS